MLSQLRALLLRKSPSDIIELSRGREHENATGAGFDLIFLTLASLAGLGDVSPPLKAAGDATPLGSYEDPSICVH